MEVTPEGKAYNIRSSIATLEQGKTEAGAYEPGSVAEVQITMWNIVYTIPAGSRIRVDVSSSDFPQYHVHSNQKGLWSEKTENKIAHQTIHTGGSARILCDSAADEKTVNCNGKTDIGENQKEKSSTIHSFVV